MPTIEKTEQKFALSYFSLKNTVNRSSRLPAIKLAAAVGLAVILYEIGETFLSTKAGSGNSLLPSEGRRLLEPLSKTAIALGGLMALANQTASRKLLSLSTPFPGMYPKTAPFDLDKTIKMNGSLSLTAIDSDTMVALFEEPFLDRSRIQMTKFVTHPAVISTQVGGDPPPNVHYTNPKAVFASPNLGIVYSWRSPSGSGVYFTLLNAFSGNEIFPPEQLLSTPDQIDYAPEIAYGSFASIPNDPPYSVYYVVSTVLKDQVVLHLRNSDGSKGSATRGGDAIYYLQIPFNLVTRHNSLLFFLRTPVYLSAYENHPSGSGNITFLQGHKDGLTNFYSILGAFPQLIGFGPNYANYGTGLLFYIDSQSFLNKKELKLDVGSFNPRLTILTSSTSNRPVTTYKVPYSATPLSSYFEIHGNENKIFIQSLFPNGTNDRAESEVAPGEGPKNLFAVAMTEPGVEVVVGYRQGDYGKAQVWRLNHPSRVIPTNISTYTGTDFTQSFSILDPDPGQTLSLVDMTEMDGQPIKEQWIVFNSPLKKVTLTPPYGVQRFYKNYTVISTDGYQEVENRVTIQIPDRAPIMIQPLNNLTVYAGQRAYFRVADYFSSPDQEPLTFSLRGDFRATFNDSLFGFSPVSGDQGFWPYTATVTSSIGKKTITSAFGLLIPNRPPYFIDNSTLNLKGRVNVPLSSTQPQAIDPDGDPIGYELTTPPADFRLGGNDIVGTPNAPGNTSFNLLAKDPFQAVATKSIHLSTVPNYPPYFLDDSPLIIKGKAGFYLSVPIPQAVDPEGDPLTYQLTSPPAGIYLSADRNITGRPIREGNTLFNLSANDPYGASAKKLIDLTSIPGESPLFGTPSPFILSPIVKEATSLQNFPPCSDPGANNVRFSLKNNPAWVRMNAFQGFDRMFIIVPPLTALGTVKFTLIASNDYGGTSEIEIHFDVVEPSTGNGPSIGKLVPSIFLIPSNAPFILNLGNGEFFFGQGVTTQIQLQPGNNLPLGITIQGNTVTGSSQQDIAIPFRLVAQDLFGKTNFQNFILSISGTHQPKPMVVNPPDPTIGASSGSHLHWSKSGLFGLPDSHTDLLTVQGTEFTIIANKRPGPIQFLNLFKRVQWLRVDTSQWNKVVLDGDPGMLDTNGIELDLKATNRFGESSTITSTVAVNGMLPGSAANRIFCDQ